MNMPHTAVDIWLHAASAADVSASLALYERLLQQDDFDIILSCGDDIMLEHLGIAGDDYFGRIPEQWTAQKLVRDHTPKTLIWIGDKINANTYISGQNKTKSNVSGQYNRRCRTTAAYQIYPNAA
jgi:3-deoxy-D-manno-octulosonic-acid transferase